MTLQPCGMCTMASIWAKIGRIVFGAGRDDVHSEYFEDRHLDTMDFIRDTFRNDLSLEGGLMASDWPCFTCRRMRMCRKMSNSISKVACRFASRLQNALY